MCIRDSRKAAAFVNFNINASSPFRFAFLFRDEKTKSSAVYKTSPGSTKEPTKCMHIFKGFHILWFFPVCAILSPGGIWK